MNEDELRGKYLAKLRLEKNLKQSDVAKMIGYSDKSISKWERGKCFPKDTKTLIKLANILDVSIYDLLHAEYSDVEGKNTPYLKNKYLNFIFQNRLIFIIIFILIILLILGYYIFFVNFKSSNNILLNGGSEVKNIDNNSLNNLVYEDDIIIENNAGDISKDKTKFDRNKIHNVLISEGFLFEESFYTKKVNENILIKYLLINNSIKVHFFVNDGELILLNYLYMSKEIVVEKFYDGKHEIEYIKNEEIRNCNIEKCESYLDYAMYINYIKKIILE